MSHTPVLSEWFASKIEAQRVASRLAAKGVYRTIVDYARDADGRHDWRLRAYDAKPVEVA